MKRQLAILISLTLPLLARSQWTLGQEADGILFQPTFLTNTAGLDSQMAKAPFGLALDAAGGKLYVVDKDNNRVLRYAYPFSTLDAAEIVFGQPDFHTGVAGGGQTGLNVPMGVAVLGGDLWIVDGGNSRVLCFKNAADIASNQPVPDIVLGQPSLDSVSAGTTQSKMSHPRTMCFDGSGNAWVVDASNNRVLKFVGIAGISSGADASIVLGQPDFTTASSGLTAEKMYLPAGIVAGPTALFVADLGNRRILRFDNPGTLATGDPASGVLGQTDFVSNLSHRGGSPDASTMASPFGLDLDAAGRLYASDLSGNRVQIFDGAAGLANGAPASTILGQSDVTTVTGATTAAGLLTPAGLCVDGANDRLLVAERDNRRVVSYSASTALPVTVASLRLDASLGTVTLRWTTVSEINNYGFIVQYAPAGHAFSDVTGSFVPGHGTTTERHEYAYPIPAMMATAGQVRLKQVDLSGATHYSDAVAFSNPTSVGSGEPVAFGLGLNYPNPFNPGTEIRFALPLSGHARVSVHSVLGEEVATLYDAQAEGGREYTVRFNGSGRASGVYFCRLSAGGREFVRMMVMAK
jgi:DNA-binding beta-propeller fold protein YncE